MANTKVTDAPTVTNGRADLRGASVTLDHLDKRFGQVVAVDGVSLDIEPGEFITLLGPSGSGKTTTLMMIAGFEIPSGGEIYIESAPIVTVPPYRRNIGIVFQNYALFPHLTVEENIGFPLKQRKVSKQEIAGFGASGRNGGWCSSSFPTSYGRIREKYGTETARLTLRTMYDAVDEVGQVCLDEGIDGHYTKSGSLRIARGRHQVDANLDSVRLYDELGFADRYSLLDKQQNDERVRVTDAVGSLLIQDCAAIHPGRLARGLARAVERQGATIYEQSRVIDFQTSLQRTLKTEQGEARARVVVLAGEAYLTQLSKLNRPLLPMYSTITLTEPIPDHLWAEIGWENRECITSNRYYVDYLQRTVDGRILFGSRGAPYRYGGPIDDHLDRHEPAHASIRDLTIKWFPMLKGIEFTHAWGGPFAIPRDWMPSVAFDERTGLATARGYSGSGVATANVAGKLLADLITGTDSELRQLPMAGHHSPDWEAEPLRRLAVRSVLWGYERVDEKAKRAGQPPSGRSLAERIGRH